jgi:hypothetical protein
MYGDKPQEPPSGIPAGYLPITILNHNSSRGTEKTHEETRLKLIKIRTIYLLKTSLYHYLFPNLYSPKLGTVNWISKASSKQNVNSKFLRTEIWQFCPGFFPQIATWIELIQPCLPHIATWIELIQPCLPHRAPVLNSGILYARLPELDRFGSKTDPRHENRVPYCFHRSITELTVLQERSCSGCYLHSSGHRTEWEDANFCLPCKRQQDTILMGIHLSLTKDVQHTWLPNVSEELIASNFRVETRRENLKSQDVQLFTELRLQPVILKLSWSSAIQTKVFSVLSNSLKKIAGIE